MKLDRLKNGGRRVVADNASARCRFEVGPEAHGQDLRIVAPDGSVVGSAYIEIREPQKKTPKRESKPSRPAAAPASSKPGDVLKWIIERRLGRKLPCGSCKEWQDWMNAEGWLKCATVHNAAIRERIREQAEKHGIDYDGILAELWKWSRGSVSGGETDDRPEVESATETDGARA